MEQNGANWGRSVGESSEECKPSIQQPRESDLLTLTPPSDHASMRSNFWNDASWSWSTQAKSGEQGGCSHHQGYEWRPVMPYSSAPFGCSIVDVDRPQRKVRCFELHLRSHQAAPEVKWFERPYHSFQCRSVDRASISFRIRENRCQGDWILQARAFLELDVVAWYGWNLLA